MAQCRLPIWKETYAAAKTVTSVTNELADEIKSATRRISDVEHVVHSIKRMRWRKASKAKL